MVISPSRWPLLFLFLKAVLVFSFLFFCRNKAGTPPLVERRSVDLA
jgi:hypothetical protein